MLYCHYLGHCSTLSVLIFAAEAAVTTQLRVWIDTAGVTKDLIISVHPILLCYYPQRIYWICSASCKKLQQNDIFVSLGVTETRYNPFSFLKFSLYALDISICPPMLSFPSVTFHSGQDSCPGLKHIHSSPDPQTAPNPLILQSHWDRGVEEWDASTSWWLRPAWVFYTILTMGWFDYGHNGIFTSHRLGSVHMLIIQLFPFPTDHQSNCKQCPSSINWFHI